MAGVQNLNSLCVCLIDKLTLFGNYVLICNDFFGVALGEGIYILTAEAIFRIGVEGVALNINSCYACLNSSIKIFDSFLLGKALGRPIVIAVVIKCENRQRRRINDSPQRLYAAIVKHLHMQIYHIGTVVHAVINFGDCLGNCFFSDNPCNCRRLDGGKCFFHK